MMFTLSPPKLQVILVVLIFLETEDSCHGYSHVKLTGAGASFPYAVYQGWQSVYHLTRLKHVDVEINYLDVGSAEGLQRLKDPSYKVDFAGTDTDLSDEDYANYTDLQLLPTMAGGVVIGFNLPGVTELNLTRDSVVGIYNGTIKFWNDSYLLKQNPGIHLPYEKILPVARHEQSGTTYLFTSALAAFSNTFRETYGVFSTPEGFNKDAIYMLGRTTLGIVGIVRSINYTLAYLSVADAKKNAIPTAKIQNKQGQFLDASHANIRRAMDDNLDRLSDRLIGSFMDANHREAYPIAGYTYLVIRMHGMTDCEKAVALYRYIEWFLTSADAKTVCGDRNMVPLSAAIIERILKKLDEMTCDGLNVAALAKLQKEKEQESSSLRLVTPLSISAVLLLCFVCLLVLAYRYYKRGQILKDSSWKIDIDDIEDLDLLPPKARSSHEIQVSDTDCWWGKIDGTWVTARTLGDAQSIASHLSRKCVIHCLYMMKHVIAHENLTRFYGLAEIDTDTMIIGESSRRGSLEDIIYGEFFPDELKFSLATDVASGIAFLHKEGLVHGTLTSRQCIIDKRWTCKVGHWDYNNVCINLRYSLKCRIHPETIRNPRQQPTSQSDCYSLGIIIYEIFARENLLNIEPSVNLYRYLIDLARDLYPVDLKCPIPENMRDVLQAALSLAPRVRPTADRIRKVVKAVNPSNKEVMDCILEKLELSLRKYEKLLQRMLPKDVADKLARSEVVEPEWFEQVTIYFSDIVGFTSLAALISPIEVVDILNQLYTTFDNIVDQYDCYKVETIGDAYMIVSGLPKRNGKRHAVIMAELAMEIVKASSEFRHKQDRMVSIRIGLHTGSVVAGVVGIKMPRYCLFGDTVNTASRMESTSASMQIQLSETTQALLLEHGGFQLMERGIIDIKGKGKMKTFWLCGRA